MQCISPALKLAKVHSRPISVRLIAVMAVVHSSSLQSRSLQFHGISYWPWFTQAQCSFIAEVIGHGSLMLIAVTRSLHELFVGRRAGIDLVLGEDVVQLAALAHQGHGRGQLGAAPFPPVPEIEVVV